MTVSREGGGLYGTEPRGLSGSEEVEEAATPKKLQPNKDAYEEFLEITITGNADRL
jgi:hypothetical protein